MSRVLLRPIRYGNWALTAACLFGLALAVFKYLNQGDGIAYSPGALLVVVSTALILAASIVALADHGLPAWVGGAVNALIILGLICTALAAYFLDSYWLMTLMIVGLVACLAQLILGLGREDSAPRALRAGSTP